MSNEAAERPALKVPRAFRGQLGEAMRRAQELCACGHLEIDHIRYDGGGQDCRNGGKWTCDCPGYLKAGR